MLSRTIFTITKKERIAKKIGANAISESKRFGPNRLDKKSIIAKRNIERSKKVLRNLTALSIIILTTKTERDTRTTPPKRICLGRVKRSVVIVVITIGKARNRRPNKKTDIVFR